MSMRQWMRQMTVEDVTAAKLLSEQKTEQDIVQMAVACVRKASLIRPWFILSCAVPVLVLAAPAIWPSIMSTDFALWMMAMLASMLLPIPASIAAKRYGRESRIIALAFWLKRDPSLLRRRR